MNTETTQARVSGTLAPIVRLRYPTAASKLSEIVAKLEEIDANSDHYCAEAVADARHDLAALAAARLYEPNAGNQGQLPRKGTDE